MWQWQLFCIALGLGTYVAAQLGFVLLFLAAVPLRTKTARLGRFLTLLAGGMWAVGVAALCLAHLWRQYRG